MRRSTAPRTGGTGTAGAAPGATGTKPYVSTMWAPTDPVWNDRVEVLPHRRLGLRDVREFRVAAGRADAVILNGAVPFRDRYRDLVLAIVAKGLGNRPRVVITDATWDVSSFALESRLPRFLVRFVPRLARVTIRLLDSPRVHYAVLSRDEARTFPQIWGAAAERVHFVPFPHTLYGSIADSPVSEGRYVFAGGNSMRDYDLLEQAVAGTDIAVHIAARWTGAGTPNLTIRTLSHAEFFLDLAGCSLCVVPLLPAVRSAGQQTYLNAMALGKLVIVTAAPGVGDYIEDGVTGVISPRDPAALRAAIEHALDPANREHYARIARNGQRRARDNFNATRYRGALLRLAGDADPADADRPEGAGDATTA